MFERPENGERAVLVHVDLPGTIDQDDLTEFTELVLSAGALPVATVTGSRMAPDPRLFVGKGKAAQILDLLETNQGEVVIFNHALSPSQERNLERYFTCRVLSRTGLILDIFAQRARSFEGKLQVELAQLHHLSTRLIRGWTHLERQKGGIGLRGPGETQLETDRRLIGARIKSINKRLEKVRRQRDQGRRARSRADVPTVSIVGYTNAGKSTLFNTMTGSAAYAADQLFATLDPTLRRLEVPGVGSVVLADTVGFIRHLPHDLVAAFHATLEETRQADLLLHVVDTRDDDRQERMQQVNQVLEAIGADMVPQLVVLNKIDLTGEAPRLERGADGRIQRVRVSAQSGAGMDLLHAALAEFFQDSVVRGWVKIHPGAGRLRSSLYSLGTVVSEQVDESGCWWVETRIGEAELDRLLRIHGTGCEFVPSTASRPQPIAHAS